LTARQLSLPGRHFLTIQPIASRLIARPLSHCPLPQQTRDEEQRGDERKAPLPGFDLNLRARMPVDLPGEVINPA